MKVKNILSLLLVLVLVLSLVACANEGGKTSGSDKTPASTASGASELTGKKLKVGILVSTVGIPALYAQEKGWFKEAGLDVELVIFATGAPVNEAIAAKELDMACSGFASVYSLANADCKWLLDINTTGGMGIFARKDSPVVAAGHTVADYPEMYGDKASVEGLEILGPVGTAVQFMVEGYAERMGLTNEGVTMLNMEYAPAYQAFTAGDGDLAAMNPPTSYTMEDEGYVKVATFEDSTGVSLFDGCFARREICESRKADVEAFVKVLVRAMDDLQDHDTRFEFSMKKFTENGTSYTDEVLEREMADRAYYGTKYVKEEGYIFGEAWGAITDFLVRAEKISEANAPNVLSSFDPSFLAAAVGADIQAYSK